ncbi:hypothetical protein LINPERHAP1_LOCUS6439 [Linum perenne]
MISTPRFSRVPPSASLPHRSHHSLFFRLASRLSCISGLRRLALAVSVLHSLSPAPRRFRESRGAQDSLFNCVVVQVILIVLLNGSRRRWK